MSLLVTVTCLFACAKNTGVGDASIDSTATEAVDAAEGDTVLDAADADVDDQDEGPTLVDPYVETEITDTADTPRDVEYEVRDDAETDGWDGLDDREGEPSTGRFGDPCAVDGDCEGGMCLVAPSWSGCTRPCDADCPDGWTCLRDQAGVSLCVPDHVCIDGDDDRFGFGPACDGADCHDGDSAIHPGADERCNGLDDDCDGDIDEHAWPAWERANALQLDSGSLTPLYRVAGGEGEAAQVAYLYDGTTLRAIDRRQRELWSAQVGAGVLFGGFDFDRDGWPDMGLARLRETGTICGQTPMTETWIDFVRGASGQSVSPLAPMADICWTFPSATYPTSQWNTATVLFGGASGTLVASPYYASTSYFLHWDAGFSSEHFLYPSTAAYDSGYTADRPNAWGTGTSYLANSHVANGLIVEADGRERLVFFTSGRVLQVAVEPYSAGQLLFDHPYLTGGRADIAGRNYGLITRDPGVPNRIALVSGTSAFSVHRDMVTGQMTTDPWGQIERHVTVYDIATNGLDDRFYSYAHDNGDGHQYEGRVVYPNTVFSATAPGSPSRLAYNVYQGGHWILHISQPGVTADLYALRGVFLWDIRDLDGDGTAEWIISPTEYPEDPDVPGYYFLKWATNVYHFDETTLSLDPVSSHPGRIPELVGTFREPDRTSSMSYLYPVLTTVDGCELKLVMRTANGEVELVGVE